MPIRLSQKYVQQVEDLAGAVVPDSVVPVLDSPEFAVVSNSIKKIHGKYLSENDANLALAVAVVEAFHSFDRSTTVGQRPEDWLPRFRAEMADEIRKTIESLPWTIQVHLPLPHFTDLAPFEFKIGERILMRRGLPVHENDLSAQDNQLLARLTTSASKRNARGHHAWLSITVLGYADSDAESEANSQAISIAKQCLYFLGALAHRIPSIHFEQRDATAFVDMSNGRRELRLPPSLSRYFAGLMPHYRNWFVQDGGATLLTGKERPAQTAEEKVSVLGRKMEIAQRFFAMHAEEDFRSIGAAMEWYIDSVTAENQTFAYIAACIGLEAVLGYGENSGRMDAMSSRLCDRYGFLLGRGRAERERLSKDYKEILDLRGELVHARSKRLTKDQQTKLYKVQDMLYRVLDQEVLTCVGRRGGFSSVALS